jgi:periplasmic copper chaperone A
MQKHAKFGLSAAFSTAFVAFSTALAGMLVTLPAAAQQVSVQNAWVRPAVPGQKGTGGFASFTAKDGAKLVGLSTDVAGVSEIHDMKMEANGTMRMFAVPGLDLPAGKTVELKPGGLHLMLLDLKAPLAKDTKVPVRLNFTTSTGNPFTQTVTFVVSPRAPLGGAAEHSGHKH